MKDFRQHFSARVLACSGKTRATRYQPRSVPSRGDRKQVRDRAVTPVPWHPLDRR